MKHAGIHHGLTTKISPQPRRYWPICVFVSFGEGFWVVPFRTENGPRSLFMFLLGNEVRRNVETGIVACFPLRNGICTLKWLPVFRRSKWNAEKAKSARFKFSDKWGSVALILQYCSKNIIIELFLLPPNIMEDAVFRSVPPSVYKQNKSKLATSFWNTNDFTLKWTLCTLPELNLVVLFNVICTFWLTCLFIIELNKQV